MSAIAGVYLLNGKSVDQNDLSRMNDCLSHRGPDGSALWCEGPVGLAHQMLWTTPESLHEKLPLEANGLVITADARIDNRGELLPALGLPEVVSDSEVILKAYGKWGKDCVDRLLGDFAFVIWDKAKGELFCARDHMGIKPFYYYYKQGEIFAFATEIKALFACGVPRRINEVRIGDYLAFIVEDKEITFYQEIKRLPPANSMTVSRDSLNMKQYWELDPTREIVMGSDEEYEKAFLDIFREAVRCRLRSAFPIGSHLSGGLDSSSIVCMARELLPKDQRLKTFSAIFDTIKECDERPYINAVLEKGDLEPYFIHGDEIGPLYDIDRVLWHMDQPFHAPNLFLTWALYKEAHNQHVRVLLDGMDGDNVVSHGITYITELTSKGRFISAIREILGLSKTRNASPMRILIKYSINPFIPYPFRQVWRVMRGSNEDSPDNIRLTNLDFARSIGLQDRRKALKNERSKPALTTREDHWRMLTWGIHSYFLEISNMASAAFSIESRSPFFDKRLMEFCMALPGDQKIRLGWTRWIMRRALRNILPEKICGRGGKSRLGANFTYGLLEHHRDVLDDFVLSCEDTQGHYVNCFALHECHNKYVSTEGAKNSQDEALNIFVIATLTLWLGKSGYKAQTF